MEVRRAVYRLFGKYQANCGYTVKVFELLLPVALGMLGGGIGLALAGRMRRSRQLVLLEADALQAQGALRAAASLLERSLKTALPSEGAFISEAHYRLCGLYVSLEQWRLGEQVCRALLMSPATLGHSGQHDVLRHLARCLENLGEETEALAVRAQADTLIEQIPDTAYRLFARQERLVRERKYTEALALQEELLTSYPERVAVPTLLCFTAFTAQHAQYPRDARHYVEQALAHTSLPLPLQWQAHRVGFHAAESLHDWPELLHHAHQLQKLSDQPLARRYLATALLLNNQLDDAEAILSADELGLRITLARLRRDFAAARLLATQATPGTQTTLLQAAIELEAGQGAAALALLDTLLEPSPLRTARRAWALALLGTTEIPPEPGDDPDQLEACAQVHWLTGNREAAFALQEKLLKQPLAPAFYTYHEAVLKQWKATP